MARHRTMDRATRKHTVLRGWLGPRRFEKRAQGDRGGMDARAIAENLECRLLFSGFSTLATFVGDVQPLAITVDSAGNLFGTTAAGGAAVAGTIWELPKGSHTIKTLYEFTGGNDGQAPDSIAVDAAGNLYGTALNAAEGNSVWELPQGSGAVIGISSLNGAGSKPTGIAIDSSGNLFGTLQNGGDVDPYSGAVWELTPAEIADGDGLSSLYSLPESPGGEPIYGMGIAVDGSDNLYIETSGSDDDGDLLELANGAATPTTVFAFNNTTSPSGGLAVDSAGNLYGSQGFGVFKLPHGSSSIQTIQSLAIGDGPQGVTLDSHGNLFGVAETTTTGAGSIFELSGVTEGGGITPPSGPGALVPTFGNVSLASQALAGSKLDARVPVVITNSGNAVKGNVSITLYADAGTSLDGNQVQLATLTKNVSLKANGSKTFDINVKSLPSTLPDGTYYILANVVDSSGNATVIATSQTVTVAAPSDSLTPVSGSLKPTNNGASGSVTITNEGNSAPGAGLSQVVIYSSPDGSSEDTLLTQFSSSLRLQASKSKTLHFRLTADEESQAAGDGYVVVDVTDPSGNDQTYGIIDNGPISGGGGSGADKLALVSTDLPSNAPIQQDITVDDTFINRGGPTDDAVVDYYISTTKGLGGHPVQLGSVDLGPLDSGEEGYGETDLSTGNIIVIGGPRYYILWADDSTNKVFASRPITFSGSGG